MKCPECDFENRESSQYCLNCGERLFLKCLECGNTLPLMAKFCDNCGQNYGKSARNKADGDIFDMIIQLQEGSSNITLKEARNQFEKKFIETKLRECDWNISQTAEVIGIERSNLHKKIKLYKL